MQREPKSDVEAIAIMSAVLSNIDAIIVLANRLTNSPEYREKILNAIENHYHLNRGRALHEIALYHTIADFFDPRINPNIKEEADG